MNFLFKCVSIAALLISSTNFVSAQQSSIIKSSSGGKPEFCGNYDCPSFSVVKNLTDDIVIRQYKSSNWVSVSMSGFGFKPAQEKGYNKLKEYLDGSNKEKAKIDMTVPVLTRVFPGLGKSNFTESFYIPSTLQTSAPKPVDTYTYIKQLPTMNFAVKSFSEDIEPQSYDLAKLVQSIIDQLNKHGISYNRESYFVAQYNKATNNQKTRYNEVWLILSDRSSENFQSNDNSQQPQSSQSDQPAQSQTQSQQTQSDNESDSTTASTTGSNQQQEQNTEIAAQPTSGNDDSKPNTPADESASQQTNDSAAQQPVGTAQSTPAVAVPAVPVPIATQTQPSQPVNSDDQSSGAAQNTQTTQSQQSQPVDQQPVAGIRQDISVSSMQDASSGSVDQQAQSTEQSPIPQIAPEQSPELTPAAAATPTSVSTQPQVSTNSVDDEGVAVSPPPTPDDLPQSGASGAAPVSSSQDGQASGAIVDEQIPQTHGSESEIGVEPVGRIDPSEQMKNSTSSELKQLEESVSVSGAESSSTGEVKVEETTRESEFQSTGLNENDNKSEVESQSASGAQESANQSEQNSTDQGVETSTAENTIVPNETVTPVIEISTGTEMNSTADQIVEQTKTVEQNPEKNTVVATESTVVESASAEKKETETKGEEKDVVQPDTNAKQTLAQVQSIEELTPADN